MRVHRAFFGGRGGTIRGEATKSSTILLCMIRTPAVSESQSAMMIYFVTHCSAPTISRSHFEGRSKYSPTEKTIIDAKSPAAFPDDKTE